MLHHQNKAYNNNPNDPRGYEQGGNLGSNINQQGDPRGYEQGNLGGLQGNAGGYDKGGNYGSNFNNPADNPGYEKEGYNGSNFNQGDTRGYHNGNRGGVDGMQGDTRGYEQGNLGGMQGDTRGYGKGNLGGMQGDPRGNLGGMQGDIPGNLGGMHGDNRGNLGGVPGDTRGHHLGGVQGDNRGNLGGTHGYEKGHHGGAALHKHTGTRGDTRGLEGGNVGPTFSAKDLKGRVFDGLRMMTSLSQEHQSLIHEVGKELHDTTDSPTSPSALFEKHSLTKGVLPKTTEVFHHVISGKNILDWIAQIKQNAIHTLNISTFSIANGLIYSGYIYQIEPVDAHSNYELYKHHHYEKLGTSDTSPAVIQVAEGALRADFVKQKKAHIPHIFGSHSLTDVYLVLSGEKRMLYVFDYDISKNCRARYNLEGSFIQFDDKIENGIHILFANDHTEAFSICSHEDRDLWIKALVHCGAQWKP